MYENIDIANLIGKTLTAIKPSLSEMDFSCNDGTHYRMTHVQDCYEDVTLDNISGDLNNLIGSPILRAEESSSRENPPGVVKEYQDSVTWTFYKIATIKGWVDLRWYGESNGYYSESVDFYQINPSDIT